MIPFGLYVGLGAAAVGALAGWTICDWRNDSRLLAAQQQVDKVRGEMQAKLDKQSATYEEWRAAQRPSEIETRNTIREIYKNAPPIPADCAVPVAGRSLLDAARQRANAASAGQFGPAVPGPAADPRTADRP